MNETIKLMGYRAAALKEDNRKQLQLINKSIRCVVLHQIREDYPQLVNEYQQGKLSYEALLKTYNEQENEKLKKFIEEYKQKAGVNDADS